MSCGSTSTANSQINYAFDDYDIINFLEEVPQDIVGNPEALRNFLEEIETPKGHARTVTEHTSTDLWKILPAYFKNMPEDSLYKLWNSLCIYAQRKSLAVKAERAFKAENSELMAFLHQPQENAIIFCEPVLKKLEAYFYGAKERTDLTEFHNMVTAGENIAKALFSSQHRSDQNPIIQLNGKSHEVHCNSYTMRALSWYMMAAAASQDALREKNGAGSASDMLDSGSLIMRDPGNRFYNFLKSNPDAYKRPSTHFAERLAHDEKCFLAGVEVGPSQNGIEDYTRNLPCQGGSILFDKLKLGKDHGEAELFVKFESTGVPPVASSDTNSTYFGMALNALASVGHNIEHSTSFISTRFSNSSAQNVRQEHLYKGKLQHIYESIKALFQGKAEFTALPKEMKTYGLPAAIKAIDKLISKATDEGNTETVNQANAVLASLKTETESLGKISDRYGIERRGAEVHTTLDPEEINNILKEVSAPPTTDEISSVQDIPSDDDQTELPSVDLGNSKPENSKPEEELDTFARPLDTEVPMMVSEEITSANAEPPVEQTHFAKDDIVIEDAYLTNAENNNGFDNTDSSLTSDNVQNNHDNALPKIEFPSTQANTGNINSADQGSDSTHTEGEKRNDKSEATTQPPPNSRFGRFTSWLSGWATYLTAWVKHLIRW